MKTKKVLFQVIFLLGLILAFMLVRSYENPRTTATSTDSDPNMHPADRIKRLEPDTPRDLRDPAYPRALFPSTQRAPSEVVEKGTEISFEVAYEDPKWERPAYKYYWHSSVSGGRWSYVPDRIHYAMHRLFTTYPTASIYYDFIHELGIGEESNKFNDKPDKPFEKVEAVVMQTEVQKVFTLGNQVAIVGKPARRGLTVLMVPVEGITPDRSDESILFQLLTPDGSELDYSLIGYGKHR